METAEHDDFDHELDPDASPLGGAETATTPSTQFSPPESPLPRKAAFKNGRIAAREKLQALSLEEKVACPEYSCSSKLMTIGITSYSGRFLADQVDSGERNPCHQD